MFLGARSPAAVHGVRWTPGGEPLELLDRAPAVVERSLALLDRLEALPLRDVEPGILFPMA